MLFLKSDRFEGWLVLLHLVAVNLVSLLVYANDVRSQFMHSR